MDQDKQDQAASGSESALPVSDSLVEISCGLDQQRYSPDWWRYFWRGLGSEFWQVRSLTLAIGRSMQNEYRPWAEIFATLADNDNVGLRNAVISLCANWGNSAVHPVIQYYPQAPAATRKYLLDILKRIPGRQSAGFLATLEEEDLNLQLSVIEAIAASGGAELQELLWQRLRPGAPVEILAAVLDALIHLVADSAPMELESTRQLWDQKLLHRKLLQLYAAIGTRVALSLILEMLPQLNARRLLDANEALNGMLTRHAFLWKLVLQDIPTARFSMYPEAGLPIPVLIRAAWGDEEAARAVICSDEPLSRDVLYTAGRALGEQGLWSLLAAADTTENTFRRLAEMILSENSERLVSICKHHINAETGLIVAALDLLFKVDPVVGWELILDRLEKKRLLPSMPPPSPLGPASAENIIRRLDHLSDGLDTRASWLDYARLVALINGSELVETIELGIQHEEAEVRAANAVCLAHIDRERFLHLLPTLLADDNEVQTAILRAIRKLGIRAALPHTRQLWDGGDPWQQLEVLRCCVELTEYPYEILEKALESGQPLLLSEALCLATRGTFHGFSPQSLRLASHTDSSVRVNAINYLAATRQPLESGTLEQLLKDASAAVRSATISYIESNADLISRTALQRAVEEETDPALFQRLGQLLARGF